jgi:hypothetical protein
MSCDYCLDYIVKSNHNINLCIDCKKLCAYSIYNCIYCDDEFDSIEKLITHHQINSNLNNKKQAGCCYYCDEYVFLSIDRTCQIKMLTDVVRYVEWLDSYVCDECYVLHDG